MIAGSQLGDSVFSLLKRGGDERENNFNVNACSAFTKLYLMPRLLTVVLERYKYLKKLLDSRESLIQLE